jgi:hypothetical protein
MEALAANGPYSFVAGVIAELIHPAERTDPYLARRRRKLHAALAWDDGGYGTRRLILAHRDPGDPEAFR